MKYLVFIADGMADEEIAELGGKTPLQYTDTPVMDKLARHGEIGLVRTVPEGFPPGSDVANLTIMGYDPRLYYTGRSPLEAASMGIELSGDDVAFRCNLVTLSEKGIYEEKIMIDYSADEITTPEAAILIKEIDRCLAQAETKFYAGFAFRHLLVWRNGPAGISLTPPHDISGRVIGPYLPGGDCGPVLLEYMKESFRILSVHPVNAQRIAAGLRPANSIWFWGQGKKPSMPRITEKYRLTGSVISAVDLIKGIGAMAGLDMVKVDGVTGTVDTNYRGKVQATLGELENGKDFVFLHVEAPDAASHRGEMDTKLRSIALIEEMLGLLLAGLEQFPEYKLMLLPDHYTPLRTMTHASEPVPFVIYRKGSVRGNNKDAAFTEEAAARSGLMFSDGHELMDYFIRG